MVVPLAEAMRPSSLDEVIGQDHLVGPNGPLRKMLTGGRLHSMILWGPPGCGKTSLAQLIGKLSASTNYLQCYPE